MTRKHQPGCPCCEGGCRCYIDSFSTSTDVTDKSNETIRDALHPQSPYPTWLRAEVELDPGNVARLYFVWDQDVSGDGMYIEVTPQDGATPGTLKLFRKNGTQLGTTLDLICASPHPGTETTTEIWHRITLCYDPDDNEVTVVFDARDSRDWVVQNQELTASIPSGFVAGRQAGYGTGSSHTGTVSFRSYRYERLWYCVDEQGCTEDCPSGSYYYDGRTVCRTCGSYSCSVAYEDFSDLPDGDMPCGWDSSGTDWQVADNKATGEDLISHEASVAGGEHIIYATFEVDSDETMTIGEVLTLTLADYTVYVERVADGVWGREYEISWGTDPSDPTPVTAPLLTHLIKLVRCPRSGCVTFNTTNYGTKALSIPTTASLSLSDSTHANLTLFEIAKTRQTDPLCPSCPCTFTCINCTDGEWPSEMIVEINGLETGVWQPVCIDCDDYNSTFYLPSGTCTSQLTVFFPPSCNDGNTQALYYQVAVGLYSASSTAFDDIYNETGLSRQIVREAGHYYLLVRLSLVWRFLSPVQQHTSSQYWWKDIGLRPAGLFNCLNFDEDLTWIGYKQTQNRNCGGGWTSGYVPSASTARVISP